MSSPSTSAVPADKTEFLDKLFGLPTSTGITGLPGATAESARALVDALKANFLQHHAFFGEIYMHSHVMDHLFAAFALGASPELLKKIYAAHDYTLSVRPSPEPITDDNFLEHVGDHDFYDAYNAIERFVFSNEFNYISDLDDINAGDVKRGEKGGKKQPAMLTRYVDVLLHPHIHVGYGVEFGIKQQVAERLAQTAMHGVAQTAYFPHTLFTTSDAKGLIDIIHKTASEIRYSSAFANLSPTSSPLAALSHSLYNDSRIGPFTFIPGSPIGNYSDVIKTLGFIIKEYADVWFDSWVHGVPEAELEGKLAGMVKEAVFASTIWYAVAEWAARGSDRVFKADFLSRMLLVRAYMTTNITMLLSCGRPKLDVAAFYAATDRYLLGPPPAPQANPSLGKKMNFFSPGIPYATNGTPWARIWANVLVHPNEHLVKIIRSLGTFANMYGMQDKGFLTLGDGTGALAGVDGTIFVRVAGLSMDRLGWAHEGAELTMWEFDEFFDAQ